MNIKDFIKHNNTVLDGAMGTELQKRGLPAGCRPETYNLTHPDTVKEIHRAYFEAGCNIVNSNTFGANSLNFEHGKLEEIIAAALELAKAAREESGSSGEKYVALDIGPLGRLLKPLGDMDFEDAVAIFAETVRIGNRCGADLIMIETFSDSYETKAALLAAKENSDLPVFVSNAYGERGKLMTGATPAAMVAMLEGMGADAIGVNCSYGPDRLAPVVREYLRYSSVPVIMKANAGIPRDECGQTVYDISADEFARMSAELVDEGVRIAGGCCGTTPDYIKALSEQIISIPVKPIEKKSYTCVSSYAKAVFFSDAPLLIGERINPTGKKRLKQALSEHDMDYILSEGIRQKEGGVHILDVNVGLPQIDEAALLEEAVCELQAVVDLPLQIDTASAYAMERALRRYNGKALINSVNGKSESMSAVFPLMKKYGGVAVALTLDENGIPSDAEGRISIAEKILRTAEEYGIDKEDIVFDTLTMAVSADSRAPRVTLDALREIKQRLGSHTLLGVSNVSFGLPERGAIGSAFFAAALENGLSAAIMNPFSSEMMKTYYSYRALRGLDENCADYIEYVQTHINAPAEQSTPPSLPPQTETAEECSPLRSAIRKGLREKAAKEAHELLITKAPLSVVTEEIVPALDTVGADYESGRVFLPQLLMSAEAAKSAFEQIKAKVSESGGSGGADKCPIVIATVHGDVHDIGKNIVKLLLENYGFEVHDLGKDVPPQRIADAVAELHAPLAGLSALMTTTVPAMEETIRLLNSTAPWCRVVVGGAVLTEDYAEKIGADKYAADAMDTVRYAEEVNSLWHRSSDYNQSPKAD